MKEYQLNCRDLEKDDRRGAFNDDGSQRFKRVPLLREYACVAANYSTGYRSFDNALRTAKDRGEFARGNRKNDLQLLRENVQINWGVFFFEIYFCFLFSLSKV